MARPDSPSSAEFSDLFEEIVVHVPEEGKARSKLVDVQTALDPLLDVCQAVLECEGELLNRCCSGFADMVTADRYRVELRCIFRRPLEDVTDDFQRRLGWKDPGMLRHVFFQNVVLNSSP